MRRRILHTYKEKIAASFRCLPKVETQNLASHEGKSNIVNALLPACVDIGSTGDAIFCVSTGLAPYTLKRSAESVSSPLRDAKW